MSPSAAAALWYEHNFKKYIRSIHEGTAQFVAQLRSLAADCQDADIIVAGYSQGAMVVHQGELQLQRDGDEETLDAIGGTLLLADGDQASGGEGRRFGSAPRRGEGVRTYLHGNNRADTPYADETAEICAAGDLFCDFKPAGLLHYKKATAIHTGYLEDRRQLLDKAVDWLYGDF